MYLLFVYQAYGYIFLWSFSLSLLNILFWFFFYFYWVAAVLFLFCDLLFYILNVFFDKQKFVILKSFVLIFQLWLAHLVSCWRIICLLLSIKIFSNVFFKELYCLFSIIPAVCLIGVCVCVCVILCNCGSISRSFLKWFLPLCLSWRFGFGIGLHLGIEV